MVRHADPFTLGFDLCVESHLLLEQLLANGHVTGREAAAICTTGKHPSKVHLFNVLANSAVAARAGRLGGYALKDAHLVRAELEHLRRTSEGTARFLGRTLDEGCAEARRRVAAILSDAPSSDAAVESAEPAINVPGPSSTSPFKPESFEWAAVTFLAARYSRIELESFLPRPFVAELRRWHRARGGTRGFASACDAAQALVVRYGADLLRDCLPLRRRLTVDLGLEPLTRFRAGSSNARQLVESAGLPREFVGTPDLDRQPAIVELERRPSLGAMERYQKTLESKIYSVLDAIQRGMVSLPTGGGKTRIAVEALRRFLAKVAAAMLKEKRSGPGPIAIWVAHSGELCEQACRSIEDVWRSTELAPPDPPTPRTHLARLWGRSGDETRARLTELVLPATGVVVVVTTPATLLNILRNDAPDAPDAPRARLRAALLDRARALIIDEAHRGAAPTHKEIGDILCAGGHCAMVGLTATPFRKTYSRSGGIDETLELLEIFEQLLRADELGADPRGWLIARGYLSRVAFQEIETGVRLVLSRRVQRLVTQGESVGLTRGQEAMADREIAARAAASAERAVAIFEAVRRIAEHPEHRVLYFGPSVLDAERTAYALLEQGIPAGVVSAGTREGARRRLIEDLREGAIRVLCNMEVLTTGFDAPKLTHVVVARPTMSLVLYEQMIGRGLRGEKFGGTARCTIVNCVDRMSLHPLVLAHTRFRQLWEAGFEAGEAGP